ncbi:MAG: hypothetical protein OQK24_11395 [Magnetovibrio sp.]|nr:hypothetical protein [Magnetovibrio sp.]
MSTNHILGAIDFISAQKYENAIHLWRMYMRFREYCTSHCGKAGMSASTQRCGSCLSDNLLYTAQQEKMGLGANDNIYTASSTDLDRWLNTQ